MDQPTHELWARWTDDELLELLEWMEQKRRFSSKIKARDLGISVAHLYTMIRRLYRDGALIRQRVKSNRQRRPAVIVGAISVSLQAQLDVLHPGLAPTGP